MSGYKLVYASARGEVEIIQLIFATAGRDYEDLHLNDDQVKTFQKDYGVAVSALPLLQCGKNEFLSFTGVISRSLAREFGLVGKDNREQSAVDFVCEIVKNLAELTSKYEATENQAEKEGLKKHVVELLDVIEGVLMKLTSGDTFFLGDEISMADLCFLLWFNYHGYLLTDLMPKYPKLRSLLDQVKGHENVSKWLSNRSTTK